MNQAVRVQERSALIKNPVQLLTALVLAFSVPVVVILMIVHLITGGMRIERDSPAMSEDAVAQRLKPVGEVNFDAAATQVAPAAAGAAPAAAAAAQGSGESVYQSACAACHATGVLNAPKPGDRFAWKPRLAQGMAALYQHAISGIRGMPPKGGNAALSDAEVKAAVDYMATGKAK